MGLPEHPPPQALLASGTLSGACRVSVAGPGAHVGSGGGFHGPAKMLRCDGDSSLRLPPDLRPRQEQLPGVFWLEAAPRTHSRVAPGSSPLTFTAKICQRVQASVLLPPQQFPAAALHFSLSHTGKAPEGGGTESAWKRTFKTKRKGMTSSLAGFVLIAVIT